MLFFYLEHVSRVPVLSSSAFAILFLVQYLCVGFWMLLRWFVGLWYFKVVLLCVVVVYVFEFCVFSMFECFESVSYTHLF